MDRSFISFLIQCDENANILRSFWLQPLSLISPYQNNLWQLFSSSEYAGLKFLLQKTLADAKGHYFQGTFRLLSPEADVSVRMMKFGDRILVHGLDSYLFETEVVGSVLTDTVQNFMKLIKIVGSFAPNENEVMIGTQFEQIQKLNNNLLNMQRQLKKAYAKLDAVNKDLNNRLVKDPLTGLVSRYQYRDEIQNIINSDPEKLGVFAFIDLDDFKKINDTYGHKAGDKYLKAFADRLLKLPFKNLSCIRIAGDEFGFYIHGYQNFAESDAQTIWSNLKETVLKEPILIDDVSLPVLCSVGLAVYGRDTHDIFDLIDFADFAMYEVKKTGKNQYRTFDIKRFKAKP